MLIHEDTDALLTSLLVMLAEKGEEETLRWVKESIVKRRYCAGTHGKY